MGLSAQEPENGGPDIRYDLRSSFRLATFSQLGKLVRSLPKNTRCGVCVRQYLGWGAEGGLMLQLLQFVERSERCVPAYVFACIENAFC